MVSISEPVRAPAFGSAAILEAARALGVLQGNSRAAPAVLAALCTAGTGAAEVAGIIQSEPGLAARVLRVANSAFYGLSRSVSTIERAVVVLGLESVRGVAATACLDRTLLRAVDVSPVDMEAIVRHSLATAAAAEALARIGHRALAPEAFIAGLLHDFGVVIQLRLNPRGITGLIAGASHAGADVASLEAEHVGVSHELCAGVVFEAWNLPPDIVAAVGHHHGPAGAPAAARPLAALLALGNELSRDCCQASPCEPGAAEVVLAEARELLGLSAAQVAAVRDVLPARVRELQRALA
jgi:HD-like signal output (HDOD) protein